MDVCFGYLFDWARIAVTVVFITYPIDFSLLTLRLNTEPHSPQIILLLNGYFCGSAASDTVLAAFNSCAIWNCSLVTMAGWECLR